MAETRWFSMVFVLGVLWALVILNIRGYGAGRWLQNLGGISTWIPAALLIAAGGVSLWLVRIGHVVRAGEPRAARGCADDAEPVVGDVLRVLGLRDRIVLGQEVKNPRRTIPRGVMIAGVITTLIYIVGTVSVLVAVPAEARRRTQRRDRSRRSGRRHALA